MRRTVLVAVVSLGLFAIGPSFPSSCAEARQPDEIKDLTQALTHASSPEPGECIRGLKAIPRFALAKRDELVEEVIQQACRSKNMEIRATAVRIGGELVRMAPEYQSIPYGVFVPSSDSEKPVLMEAFEATALRGGPYNRQALKVLVRLLKDKDAVIRARAYGHLGMAGERACLTPGFDVMAFVSTAMIENLDTESPDPDPVSVHLNMLPLAVRTLGKVGRRSPRAVPALLKAYARFPANTKRDAEMRNVVIDALAEIGPFSDKSLPFLTKLMRNEQLPIQERAWVARAIGRFGPAATDLVPDLIALLKTAIKQPNQPPWVSKVIVDALVWLEEAAEPAVPYLLELAQGPDNDEVTKAAVRAIYDLAPVARKQAAPVFAKLYFAKGQQQWGNMYGALARFGADLATPFVLKALRSDDPTQQYLALGVLQGYERWDAKPVIPDLKRIAEDKKHPMQGHAQRVLKALGL